MKKIGAPHIVFIISILLISKESLSQLVSDYCKETKSPISINNRVYYWIEKDLLGKEWVIRGNNGIVGRIEKGSSYSGEEWKVKNKLGQELGYIDDKDFIKRLKESNYGRISIEKDFLGNFIIREYGMRIGKINKPYNDTPSFLMNDESSPNSVFHQKFWSPMEEVRRWTTLPDPLEQIKKELDPLKDIRYQYQSVFPSFKESESNELYKRMLPDPMEDVRRNILNPFGIDRKVKKYPYTYPSTQETYGSFFNTRPKNGMLFDLPSIETSPFPINTYPTFNSIPSFDSGSMFGDDLFGDSP
ncbi:MAG: hypothetical protein N3G21_06185 [Candidatus Hydrogenedentes bacterium]|nr:hypothetical protein [Candidatus Hydrogenedentota bacterium]